MRLAEGMGHVRRMVARVLAKEEDGEMEYHLCRSTNTTYLDCPTKRMLEEKNGHMVIKLFNPASTDRHEVVRVKVPPP